MWIFSGIAVTIGINSICSNGISGFGMECQRDVSEIATVQTGILHGHNWFNKWDLDNIPRIGHKFFLQEVPYWFTRMISWVSAKGCWTLQRLDVSPRQSAGAKESIPQPLQLGASLKITYFAWEQKTETMSFMNFSSKKHNYIIHHNTTYILNHYIIKQWNSIF
jgi:hypothetical protein